MLERPRRAPRTDERAAGIARSPVAYEQVTFWLGTLPSEVGELKVQVVLKTV